MFSYTAFHIMKQEIAISSLSQFGSLYNNENIFMANIVNIIEILTFLISLTSIVIRIFKGCHDQWNKKNKRPGRLSVEEVETYTKYYIKTHLYQKANPSKRYSVNRFISSYLLRGCTQYHVILADAGMGKSAFLLNVYYKVFARIFKKGYKIEYFSLRTKEAITKIEEIEQPQNTILLLDAFDESLCAAEDAKKFLKQIETVTEQFAKIVITSRINFFDNEHDEPNEVTGIVRPIEVRDSKYCKHYITSFTLYDVGKYLLKRYRLNLYKHVKAWRIIVKATNIMSRPFLLSYIDELFDVKIVTTAFEVYRILIRKWIDREVDFLHHCSPDKEHFDSVIAKTHYTAFVNKIAVQMYKNAAVTGEYVIDIAALNDYAEFVNKMTPYRKRCRSLLDRVYDNSLKFSHLSVFEFLLATNLESIGYLRFERGLKMLYQFLYESYHLGLKLVESAKEYWYENILDYDENPYKDILIHREVYDDRHVVFWFGEKLSRTSEPIFDYSDKKEVNIFEQTILQIFINISKCINIPYVHESTFSLVLLKIDICRMNTYYFDTDFVMSKIKGLPNTIIPETGLSLDHTLNICFEAKYERLFCAKEN